MRLKRYILEKLYIHKYGIMGTVIFHLLVAIFLLSVGIAGLHMPEAFEVELAATPLPEQKKAEEEKQRREEIRKKTSREEVEKMLRSIAVNENVKKDLPQRNVQQYIDEVREEIDRNKPGKGKYRGEVSEVYKQDSLRNRQDRQEALLDSLKSTFYSGKSSVSYNLADRYARILPIPVFRCEYGGKVVVNIQVSRKGAVQRAEVAGAESDPDECLHEAAVSAALRSRFNEKPGAPAVQIGTITYHFVKQ